MLTKKQREYLEKEMATHSSVLAWEIPRTENLAGYGAWGRERVRHDLATKRQQRKHKVLSQEIWGAVWARKPKDAKQKG